MKKFTKAIAIAASTLISAGAFAQEQVQLRFSWWGGSLRHTQTLEAIKAFEETHPDIKINAEYSGWSGYLTKLSTQIAGGTEPDIMQLNWNWLDVFSARGDGFYDLYELDNLDTSGYSEGSLMPVLRNGKLHAITISMSGWPQYYNETTWKKAGIDYPKTWEELLSAGQVFKEKLGNDYYPVRLDPKEVMLLTQQFMIQKYGVSLIDQEKKKIAYSDAQLEEMFDLYRQMVDNHVLPSRRLQNAYGSGAPETMRPWIEGQWAGTFTANPAADNAASFLAEGQKLVSGPFLQMVETPKEAGAFYRPSQVFSIAKNSDHPEEAALFIDFLLHSKEAMDIVGDVRGIPFQPAAFQYLVDSGQLGSDNLNYQGFQILESQTYITPVSAYIEDEQLHSEYASILEKMDYENWSPERAAKDFRRKADRILRRAIRT